MTAEECHRRASTCAANAAVAVSETVALEFMKLAAKWRAMAARAMFVGPIDDRIEAVDIGGSQALPAGQSEPLRHIRLR